MCILAEQLEFSDDLNLPTCWQGWSACFTWFFYTSQKILLCQAQNRARRNENVSVPIFIFSTNMCHYCILNGTTFIALFETFYHHLPSPSKTLLFILFWPLFLTETAFSGHWKGGLIKLLPGWRLSFATPDCASLSLHCLFVRLFSAMFGVTKILLLCYSDFLHASIWTHIFFSLYIEEQKWVCSMLLLHSTCTL